MSKHEKSEDLNGNIFIGHSLLLLLICCCFVVVVVIVVAVVVVMVMTIDMSWLIVWSTLQ
jgi:hypothetical protein